MTTTITANDRDAMTIRALRTDTKRYRCAGTIGDRKGAVGVEITDVTTDGRLVCVVTDANGYPGIVSGQRLGVPADRLVAYTTYTR